MTRYDLLEKEINKGIQVDERTNQLINGWSPNNVRRLIIGFDFAVVQYFVTGGKYGRLIEIVDFRKVIDSDIASFQSNPQSYRSILQVLTKGRVCSSVEEIVFSTDSYPQPILNADTNFGIMAKSVEGLGNRFPRLRHISLSNLPVKHLAQYADISKKRDTLLLTVLKEKEVPLNTVVDMHASSWWKGNGLRSRFYSMDAGVLQEYFSRLRERLELVMHDDKVDTANEKRNLDVCKKLMPATISVIQMLDSGTQKAHSVFEKVPIVSKAEWASVLMFNNTYRTMRKVLSTHPDTIKQVRAIDFEGIVETERNLGVSPEDVLSVLNFRDMVFNFILTEAEYKRESNKLPVYKSVPELQNFVSLLFNTYINTVYLSLVKYLTRNTVKYVREQHKLLQGLDSLRYTRSMIEFCNTHGQPDFEVGIAKQAFDMISAIEVLSDSLSLLDRFSEADAILDSYLRGFTRVS